MKIDKIEVGFLHTNCYILNKDNNCLIIDPGDEYPKIKAHITGNVSGIIITHYHFDHVGALDDLTKEYNVKVYDYSNLNEGINRIDNFEFTMIRTPGHKNDLISLLFDNHLFCGDFIFEDSIGRTDLAGGNFYQMQESIKHILTLPKNTIIYPGHGNITTLQKEELNLRSYL